MDKTPVVSEKYYKIKEIAELFDVTERTVWGWCADGRLQSIKVGRLRRISDEALAEFLAGGDAA